MTLFLHLFVMIFFFSTYLYSLYSQTHQAVETLFLFKCWRDSGELRGLRLSFAVLQSEALPAGVFLTGLSKLFTARNGDFSFSKSLISKLAGDPDLDRAPDPPLALPKPGLLSLAASSFRSIWISMSIEIFLTKLLKCWRGHTQLSSYLLNFLQLRLRLLVVVLQISPVWTSVIVTPLGVLLLLQHRSEVHTAGVCRKKS